MPNLAALTVALPILELASGDLLTVEGTRSGKLYVLESGKLSVVRNGVTLAVIDEPGAIVGEMAVLLGNPHSATVSALGPARLRVLHDALDFLSTSPDFALHLATLACARLDATSALLVELSATSARKEEQALLGRIFKSLSATPAREFGRGGWANYE